MDSAASAMEDQAASSKVELDDIVNDPGGSVDELPMDTGTSDEAAGEDEAVSEEALF